MALLSTLSNVRTGNTDKAAAGVVGLQSSADSNLESVVNQNSFEGSNGSYNNEFSDESSGARTITAVGRPGVGTFSPFSANGCCMDFGASNDEYISYASNSDFALGTNDFTIEFWARWYDETTSNTQVILTFGSAGNTEFGWQYSGSNFVFDIDQGNRSTYAFTPDRMVWYHLCVTRTSGNSYTLYIDGTSVHTFTYTFTQLQEQLMIGGISWATGYSFKGQISNFRLINGSAVAPDSGGPTSHLEDVTNTKLLLFTDASYGSSRDISSLDKGLPTKSTNAQVMMESPIQPFQYNPTTHGGGVWFDEEGDYITCANDSNLEPLTSLTIECWAWFDNASDGSFKTLWSYISPGTNPYGLSITVTSNEQLGLYGYNSGGGSFDGSLVFGSSGAVPLREWVHLAVTRDSGTWRGFVNGKLQSNSGTFTTFSYASGTPILYIAAQNDNFDNNRPQRSYYSSYRYINGNAKYTADFSVPTSPFIDETNTKLLLNFTSSDMRDETGKEILSYKGTAGSITTAVKKNGSSSLSTCVSSNLGVAVGRPSPLYLLSGDWTVEFWYQWNNSTAAHAGYYRRIMDFGGGNADNSMQIIISIDSGDETSYEAGQGAAFAWDGSGPVPSTGDAVVTPAVSEDTWVHFAMEKYGTNLYNYQNGTLYTTRTVSDSDIWRNSEGTGDDFIIGAECDSNNYGRGRFDGFIDDLRITRGVARYQGMSFTPPTLEFTV